MIQYDKIRRVRIELSTKCNSTCPDCPRNLRGVEILDNIVFPITQLYLDDIKKIFVEDFLRQLHSVSIDGNFGDFVTARDCLEIVQYLVENNPELWIDISTNGSARPDIWKPLGELGQRVNVVFRLDGMKDTHHLYRQNTNWEMIIANAQQLIAAGGKATWAMIVFDHNRHQIDECRSLSQQLGFYDFRLIDNPSGIRNSFPVFRKDRSLSHIVGGFQGTKKFDEIHSGYLYALEHPEIELNYVVDQKKITCKTMTIIDDYDGQEIYVSADGNVFPCCWTGFYPGFKSSRYSNKQLLPIMKENNALTYGIKHAVKWFEDIAKTWNIPTVRGGRISICNQICGHD